MLYTGMLYFIILDNWAIFDILVIFDIDNGIMVLCYTMCDITINMIAQGQGGDNASIADCNLL